MNAGKNYTVKEFFFWTIRDIIWILLVAITPTFLFILGIKWVVLPLSLVSLVGVATSFILGFKNSATYDRTWEARKIYGGIVNVSRSFAMSVNNFLHYNTKLNAQEIQKNKEELLMRHFAWMTALRHQLRQYKIWESINLVHNKKYQVKFYKVREWEFSMEEELQNYLSPNEMKRVLKAKNKASILLSIQGTQLKNLLNTGNLDLFHQIDLQSRLYQFYDLQGKCERIKNFPYPRHYASICKYFVIIFVVMIPFGLISEFQKIASSFDSSYFLFFTLLNIPASALIMWIFMIMERVGEGTENPFEGSPNDIPITSMSLNIENDCRDIIGLERIVIAAPDHKIIT